MKIMITLVIKINPKGYSRILWYILGYLILLLKKDLKMFSRILAKSKSA